MFNLALLLQRKNQCAEAADYWRRYLAIDGQSTRTPITQIVRDVGVPEGRERFTCDARKQALSWFPKEPPVFTEWACAEQGTAAIG